MKSNISILKSIFNNGGSLVNQMYDFYRTYGITKKEILAFETFFFEPNMINASKAIESTPKAWLIVKEYIKQEKGVEYAVIERISLLIEKGELDGRYMRKLVVHNYLNDLLQKLLTIGTSNRLKRFVAKYQMEEKLKR